MNQLATKYSPSDVEDKWYAYWMEHDLFASHPDAREPYTIVIPPPNVTGVLHMGHMLNNTIQDILIRRARMDGKNALWVPGTDHASIATETKVIGKLAAEGIRKIDLTREEFLKHAWEWTEKHGGIILKQLRKLGASCDWSRTAFTMDEARSESVVKVFCDLYDKGLIYRANRMVNWDPENRTAISDDEVYYVDEKSKLYYLKYYVADDDFMGETGEEGEIVHRDSEGRRYAVVATTRPETIMGDTAMCINPKDPKNRWLAGKKVVVPLVGRVIPVIEDRYVEIDFGTGCLKVTPAHDKNDNMLGKKHGLETIDIFNEDATVSEAAGMYVGMDRFECRKQIAQDLEAAGLMEKIEDYENKVGCSERTKVAIEPRLSLQWFIDMKHFASFSLAPVMDDIIKFVPEKYKTTYRTWLENIQDWCISRQLWWGHRIPAYFYGPEEDDTFVVAETKEQALEKARAASGNAELQLSDLRQDEGALDTWFSSWLWPITLFDGIRHPGNEEMKYYYPTATLVTGPDIIFFWVARMIMAGYEYAGDKPFSNVYFTGIVRDKLGRKMSKQLGNSPDPLELIARFGADGVRMGMMLCAPAGNDIMFDDKLCETGRNFCNKIWNAFRLVKGWEVDETSEQPESSCRAIAWMESKISEAAAEVADLMGKFRISEALTTLYKLFWDEFSAWYLELVKPAYGSPIDGATMRATEGFFDALLRLLHPFMPFITEELWQHLADRREGESIMYASTPAATTPSEADMAIVEEAKEIVNGVRNVRASKGLSPRLGLTLNVVGSWPKERDAVIKKLAGVDEINHNMESDPAAASFMVGSTEVCIPLGGAIDTEAELARLTKDLDYYKGFRQSVMKKLSNERFVAKAPESVVSAERQKLADAEAKIETLSRSIEALKG
ncbi:MAG: valine--tRNA ligase [Pseudoflavonifractor sp.]|nr:valine--tRNA ligase [Alloprevotella sp.]MCM1117607.1 valine--tRNA ligase [Pseudoflavonifractor sp.]